MAQPMAADEKQPWDMADAGNCQYADTITLRARKNNPECLFFL
jgi:hypothetical protein